jgi:hypothetical protein
MVALVSVVAIVILMGPGTNVQLVSSSASSALGVAIQAQTFDVPHRDALIHGAASLFHECGSQDCSGSGFSGGRT